MLCNSLVVGATVTIYSYNTIHINSLVAVKSFSNLQDVFVVKLPPRCCDIASVNHKVNIYNQLPDDHFTNIESVSIIDTVALENRFLYGRISYDVTLPRPFNVKIGV